MVNFRNKLSLGMVLLLLSVTRFDNTGTYVGSEEFAGK